MASVGIGFAAAMAAIHRAMAHEKRPGNCPARYHEMLKREPNTLGAKYVGIQKFDDGELHLWNCPWCGTTLSSEEGEVRI